MSDVKTICDRLNDVGEFLYDQDKLNMIGHVNEAIFTLSNQAKAIAEKDQEIERLIQTMKDVHQDLVLRANMSGDHYVGLSSSQWIQLCEAVGQIR